MKYCTFALVFCALLGLSCSSPIEEDSSLIYLPPPIVTGMWLTSTGGVILSAWGTPSWPILLPSEFEFALYPPVPNPSRSMATITFTIPIDTRINLFIVRARLAGAEPVESNTIGGGTLIQTDNIIVRQVINNLLSAGHHSYTLDWKDDNGNDLPAGFYRIYAIVGNKVLWQDALLTRTDDDLPSSLLRRP